MTRKIEPTTARSAWAEAEAAGVDMELLDASLRLTPTQRLHRHQQALELAGVLGRGKIRSDDRIEPSARTPAPAGR